MNDCDFNCDGCTRTLCTQGNLTLEPTPDELKEIENALNAQFFGATKAEKGENKQ